MKTGIRRFFTFSVVGFFLQLAVFAWVYFERRGAPAWLEWTYFPFQALFVNLLGEYWTLGLPIGLIIGTACYSFVFGAAVSLVFRTAHQRNEIV